jgi:threonine/homoserine/homoserine lactone efflux protein
MEPATLASAALAGAIVVLTPGPAVLAVIAIGAGQGRGAGARFILAHLAGDTLWAVLALVAMVGANLLAPLFFEALAIVCGGYLLYIGGRAVLARRAATGTTVDVLRPALRGLAFGLTNPKSYPVTLATFTALLADDVGSLTPANAPLLLLACFAGFLAADAVLIWLVGLPPLRRLYLAHGLAIVRATGAMFVGFAVLTLESVLVT